MRATFPRTDGSCLICLWIKWKYNQTCLSNLPTVCARQLLLCARKFKKCMTSMKWLYQVNELTGSWQRLLIQIGRHNTFCCLCLVENDNVLHLLSFVFFHSIAHFWRHLQLDISHIANVMLPIYIAKGKNVERERKVLRYVTGKVLFEGAIQTISTVNQSPGEWEAVTCISSLSGPFNLDVAKVVVLAVRRTQKSPHSGQPLKSEVQTPGAVHIHWVVKGPLYRGIQKNCPVRNPVNISHVSLQLSNFLGLV